MRDLFGGMWPGVRRGLWDTSRLFGALAGSVSLVFAGGAALAGQPVPLDQAGPALGGLALLYGFSGLSIVGIGVGLKLRPWTRHWDRPTDSYPWAERVALGGVLLVGGLYQAGGLLPDAATPGLLASMVLVLSSTLGLWWYLTRQARRAPPPAIAARPAIPWAWRMSMLLLTLIITWSTTLAWLLPLADPVAFRPARPADLRRGTAFAGMDLCLVAAVQSTAAQRRADLRRRRDGELG